MRKKLFELALMPLFGTVMFLSKLLMDALPNVHLIAMFIVLFTVLFRAKALISIYIFVFLTGIYGGFGVWWVPYLYIWTILWGVVMLLPRNMKPMTASVVYIVICGLHGFLYGVLYAPFQAFAFGLDFKGTVAWIIAGLYFDVIHGLSNLITGSLVLPILIPLKRVLSKYQSI